MKMSPMMTHYLQIKEKHKDAIVFYRLGDFYEMFFEDAITASKELEITLTGRNCGMEERAPMCGVPFHSYESYVHKLIEKGYKVAICEQLTQAEKSKMVERDVVRIITAGTLTESTMLESEKNNYIMCIYKQNNTISYSYCDISTGEFKVGTITGNDIIEGINDQIVRIDPSEILCNDEMKSLEKSLPANTRQNYRLNSYYQWCFSYNSAKEIIERQYNLNSIVRHDFAQDKMNVCVIGALFQFLFETQKKSLINISLPIVESANEFMYIDAVSRKNLELEDNNRFGQKKDTLLWVLDDTQTSMGKRLLKNYIRQPLQSVSAINERYKKVEQLYNNALVRKIVQQQLNKISDIERLSSRIAVGTINPKECITLAQSLAIIPKLSIDISSLNDFSDIINDFKNVENIYNLIFDKINIDAPLNIKDGGIVKTGVSEKLDYYRGLSLDAKTMISKMEAEERIKTGIKNLKISFNKVFGYYIEVNKQFSNQIPFDYVRKQTVSNNERYISEKLKEFENEVLSAEENIYKLESNIFDELKNMLLGCIEQIKKIALAVAKIDVMYSFAEVSTNFGYVKPVITNSNLIKIKNGRHPVIEKNIGKSNFITNDINIDSNENQILIITGPNMAGKSTYMRQNAIIVLMAHIGCFVPCDSAEIGIVDRIFTRIGASDDLSSGQSTFMVEMVEVANILNCATDKSLILLDEVGRGTSTYDGLSIAWSVVEYLSNTSSAKTLFATHYHELTELESNMKNVKNYRVTITEIGGEVVFLRKIERGGAMKSFGIEVASLAGLPKNLIENAKSKLYELELNNISSNNNEIIVNKNTNSTKSKINEKIVTILSQTDINNISPMKSLEILEHLISLSNKGGNDEN